VCFSDLALSVSITAVANVVALLMTPTNFAWMIAGNPNTAAWLQEIEVDPGMIWINLVMILAIPLILGLLTRHYLPNFSDRVRRPMGRFAVAALFAFVIVALIRDRHMFLTGIGGLFVIVVLHNAIGLALGYLSGILAGLSVPDRRALTFETGMQNSGLALAIIGTQFDADVGMVIVAGLWGTWHIVSGFSLAHFWRTRQVECLTQE
jgi:BASS family bile acid:Na+ symporter